MRSALQLSVVSQSLVQLDQIDMTVPDPNDCGNSHGPNDKEFDRNSWIIAVCLAIAAAFVNNLGVNLQKLAWTKKQTGSGPNSLYRTFWLLGMVGIVMASFCDFAALAFGPQSVIAPLGSLTMVANAFVAPMMHGEKLHPNVVTSTLVIVAGCAMSVAAASHSNEICSIDMLFALYTKPRFLIYALIFLMVTGFGQQSIRRFEYIQATFGDSSPQYQEVFKTHRVSYASMSGLIGAQSVLFAKSVDQLLIASTRGDQLFLAYPGTYMVVGAMASAIILQIYYLNQGLSRFQSLYNVPVFTATWIVGTVIGGGVFYGEFSDFSAIQAFVFPFGVGLCILGVVLLSQGEVAAANAAAAHTMEPMDCESNNDTGRGENGAAGSADMTFVEQGGFTNRSLSPAKQRRSTSESSDRGIRFGRSENESDSERQGLIASPLSTQQQ